MTQRSSNRPIPDFLDDLLYPALGCMLAKYLLERSDVSPDAFKSEYSSEVFPEDVCGASGNFP